MVLENTRCEARILRLRRDHEQSKTRAIHVPREVSRVRVDHAIKDMSRGPGHPNRLRGFTDDDFQVASWK